MVPQHFSAAERAQILAPAAWLFGLGLVIGMVFLFAAIGHIAAWPLVPALDIQMPGSEEAWRRTHLGMLINAVTMVAFAVAGGSIRLTQSARRGYIVCVWVTGWANSLGFLVGALFGVRGLEFGGAWSNSLNYLLFLIAVPSAFGQAWLLWRGARNAIQEAQA